MKRSLPPDVRSMDLDIEGMHCAACVVRIERFLTKVEGVDSAAVNLATNQARVVYNPARASVTQLVDAVGRAGYNARLRTDAVRARGALSFDRDLAGAASIALPVLAAGMLWMHRPLWAEWVLCVASAAVVFGFGRSFFVGAWRALKSGGGATMDTLIAIGSLAAWGYSFGELVLAQRPRTYFETGSTIVVLILMGRYLEGRARRRAGDAVRALAALTPQTALRVDETGLASIVPLDSVRVGDILRIRPGEKAPVDGVVVAGSSALDESLLTGESAPVDKEPGATVVGGSMNTTGALDIQATAVGAATVLARIVRLVEDAQASKPPVQRLADRISAVFVPVVLVISFATLFVWLGFGAPVVVALRNAVAVLVIACPCALGLATPTAIIVAVGRAASRGILIRDAQALETAGKVGTVVFDKTGTLTQGRFMVTSLLPASGVSEQELLNVAAAAEQSSEHPIALGILRRAALDNVSLTPAEAFQSFGGSGVSANIDGRCVLVGTTHFLEEHAVTAPLCEREAQTVVHVAQDGQYLGAITSMDTPRDGAHDAIAALMACGLRVAMLTGDADPVARAIAGELDIEILMSAVKPQQKVEAIMRLCRDGAGGVVAMVGDGVNDAAALAAADVGIAMGGASDVASEAAGVTLLRADLNAVEQVIRLSRRTFGVIRQNLFWAFAFNSIGIPLAATGHLSPMIAALAMAFSSVAVVSNSLRLRSS